MLNTILVALDDSDLSERVIKILGELHITADSKIILSHVISSLESDVDIAADRPQTNTEEMPYRQIEKRIQSYQTMLPCACELEIVSGDPAEEIIRLAHIYKADLIVIGTRGLTGLKRILQGSVSSQVVTDAPCSVLVVKH